MLARMLRHLLPGCCVLCRQPLAADAEPDLCRFCLASLPWNALACERCAAPLPHPDQPLCGDCERRPPPFRRALAPLRYEGWPSRWIGRLKDRLGLVEGRLLGAILADAAESFYLPAADDGRRVRPDALVPVPLTWRRLAWRGHNQALTLALPVARRLQVPVWRHTLVRVRTGRRQRGLDRGARAENVGGLFRCRRRWAAPGPCLAVVDDVMTTGTTAAAISRALLDAGASEVHVLCAARTPRRRQPALS